MLTLNGLRGDQLTEPYQIFESALLSCKDADSNAKDLTVNQKCLDITHLV